MRSSLATTACCREPAPDEALQVGREESVGEILVLADMAMPQMTGRALVDRLREDHSDVKALYSWGYRADLVVHQSAANADEYIQKPFTPNALAERIRAMLHP